MAKDACTNFSQMMTSHVAYVRSSGTTWLSPYGEGEKKERRKKKTKKLEKLNCQPTILRIYLCSAFWAGPVGTPVPGFHRSPTPLFIEYETVTDTHWQTAMITNLYFRSRSVIEHCMKNNTRTSVEQKARR